MTKILFICLGNICRSPMAEFVMKDPVEKAGLADEFQIDSAATCRDEIGNPVYPPARRSSPSTAFPARDTLRASSRRRTTRSTICSSAWRARTSKTCSVSAAVIRRGKMHRLLDYTDRPGDVADPWYTGDFEATWRDVSEGCKCLLAEIEKKRDLMAFQDGRQTMSEIKIHIFPHRQGVRRAGAAVRRRALQRAQGVWRAG